MRDLPSSAYLDAVYAPKPALPTQASTELIMTIVPDFLALKNGRKARVKFIVPNTLVLNWFFNVSGL